MQDNITTFDFSVALNLLKEGKKLTRKGWNGQGMFCVLSPGAKDLPYDKFFSQSLQEYVGKKVNPVMDIRPSFLLKTAQEDIAYWTPSGSDILAEDWIEVA